MRKRPETTPLVSAWTRDRGYERAPRGQTAMSDAGQETDPHMTRPDESGVESDNGSRGRIQSAAVRTRIASQRHVSLAVPFRAAERNRRVASSVLAGGVASRLFLWLLPFSFLVGGVLGLGDEEDIEEAVAGGGLCREAVVAANGTSLAPRRRTRGGSSCSACGSSCGRDIRERRRCAHSRTRLGRGASEGQAPSRARSSSAQRTSRS